VIGVGFIAWYCGILHQRGIPNKAEAETVLQKNWIIDVDVNRKER